MEKKLLFAKTHEWISLEGDKAKIGITDYAQKELGDLVFIELPEVGAKLTCNKPFCNVESVKAVSEIYSPACGKVISINTQLETNPEKINQDAFGSWIVEIELEKLADNLSEEE